jgi:hypothetical protein
MKPPFQYLDWTCVYINGGRALHHFGGAGTGVGQPESLGVGMQYVV